MTTFPERTTIAKPADRAEWLAVRRPFFNASSASVLFDRHPFQSPGDLAAEKLSGAEQAETSAMRRGRHLEHAVAAWWEDEHGVRLVQPDVLYVCGPLMATLDRHPVGVVRPVEIKTTNHYAPEPEGYWLDQCQAQMLCCGGDVATLVWIDSSMELREVDVEADVEFQAELLARAEKFMAAIEFGMVPDWVRMSAANVQAVHPTGAGEVELDEVDVAFVQQYVALREEKKSIEAEMAEIKDRIASVLADREVATFDGRPVVTWKAQKASRTFDHKRFVEEHPDLAEPYMVEKPGPRVFLPKIGVETGD